MEEIDDLNRGLQNVAQMTSESRKSFNDMKDFVYTMENKLYNHSENTLANLNKQTMHSYRLLVNSLSVKVEDSVTKITKSLNQTAEVAKKEITDAKSSFWVHPFRFGICLLMSFMFLFLGARLRSYQTERTFAAQALEDETESIEQQAINEYKKALVQDEFGSRILELEIRNIEQHKKNWPAAEKEVADKKAELTYRRARENNTKRNK
jgi:hypothetical protein